MTRFVRAYNDTHEERRAVMVSQTQQGASDWLDCVPFIPELCIKPEAFAWNVQRWTGGSTRLEQVAAARECGCGSGTSEGKWDHVDNCKRGGFLQLRHDRIVRQITNLFSRAGATAQAEQRGSYEAFGQGGPDIVVRDLVHINTEMLVEVAVTNPTAHGKSAAVRVGVAAANRERSKHNKYDDKAKQHDVQLRVAVVETTGGLGKTFRDLIKLATTRAKQNNRSLVPDSAPWSSSRPAVLFRQCVSATLRSSAYDLAKGSHKAREQHRQQLAAEGRPQHSDNRVTTVLAPAARHKEMEDPRPPPQAPRQTPSSVASTEGATPINHRR
jgi:hypothetical protein